MKTTKKRLGIIGCGGRVRGVVKRVLDATEDIEVVALCDPCSISIEYAKKRLNKKATVYESPGELLKDSAVDWVIVGSWNCLHAEHVIAAFEAGKHVFCEKPLALTVEDCMAMRDAWKKSGKNFTMGFNLRYSPHYIRIKEIVSSGTIGDIISMEFNETLEFNHGGYIHSNWRRKTEWAGTHLLEKCSHDMDLVNWIVESTVLKAASFGGCDFFISENAHHIERIGKSKDGKEAYQTVFDSKLKGNVYNPFNDDKDILDNQVAILEFANGVRATFHTNCNAGIPERRMYICGTEGAVRADVLSGSIEVQRIGFETEIEDMSTDSSGGHGGGDQVLSRSLAESILNGAPAPTSLEHGIRSAITAFGIDEAQRTGQVYDLSPLWKQAGFDIQ